MLDKENTQKKARIIYFSHGGGPMPILGDASHRAMVEFMEQLPETIEKPDAILVISAHWEETTATLLSSESPALLYDYYGFPQEAYNLTYPAPGAPQLADRIAGALEKHHFPTRLDPKRGFDHGLYVPLLLMYPEADIPALQISLLQGLSPEAHIAMGRALADFRQENILVIGSGFSFHNMLAFKWEDTIIADPKNDVFQDWLIETCTGPMDQPEREKKLIGWEEAPSARYCHPREEHLLPLHVCLGMAGEPAKTIFDDYILGKRSVAFLW